MLLWRSCDEQCSTDVPTEYLSGDVRCDSAAQAEDVARALVAARSVACAQVDTATHSVLLKTLRAAAPSVDTELQKQKLSAAWTYVKANPDYLAWMQEEVGASRSASQLSVRVDVNVNS